MLLLIQALKVMVPTALSSVTGIPKWLTDSYTGLNNAKACFFTPLPLSLITVLSVDYEVLAEHLLLPDLIVSPEHCGDH